MRQEGFVQQLAKQEAVPRASEQKVIDEDDEQGHNLIKDQFYNEFRDQLISMRDQNLSKNLWRS